MIHLRPFGSLQHVTKSMSYSKYETIIVIPDGTVSLHTVSEQSSEQTPVILLRHSLAGHAIPVG